MIGIKPSIEQGEKCPYCGTLMEPSDVLWQGIHVCAVFACRGCGAAIVGDLKVGHAVFYPFQADLKKDKLFGRDIKWFGETLINSLKSPNHDHDIEFEVEKRLDKKNVVILNCIDFLYGHCLLKLLNAEKHLKCDADLGLVLIIPRFLRWMVPNGVAEVWTVNIPLSKAQNYYPALDARIKKECERFERIFVSPAHSHPKEFDITFFTGIERHDFSKKDFRITFIWREDRLWPEDGTMSVPARIPNLKGAFLLRQNLKVRKLFSLLKRSFPDAVFTVAGLGKRTDFPEWIDDRRVGRFTDELEREACRIYAESRTVIGVHGSSMLLPSAFAGLTVDLMPVDRWGNFAQDVLYQEDDSRMSSYRYRYVPAATGITLLNKIISWQLKNFFNFKAQMVDTLGAGRAPEGL